MGLGAGLGHGHPRGKAQDQDKNDFHSPKLVLGERFAVGVYAAGELVAHSAVLSRPVGLVDVQDLIAMKVVRD